MNLKISHKRKLIATTVFSAFASIIAIIHGIFFDMDFSQIGRLSLGGFVLTFILIFIVMLLLEWIFDIENHEAFLELDKRVKKLEKKTKKK